MDKRFSFAACFTLENMIRAADECYKRVRWKGQPQRFMDKKLTNCVALLKEVYGKSYSPRLVRPFVVRERGKVRSVKPVAFRDRVVQRCFCDNVLVDFVEDYVTDECTAVLPNRGLSAAHSSVRKHAERCIRDGWVLRYDYSSYFKTIGHEPVVDMFSTRVDDDDLVWFLKTVVGADEGGLELGSHVSQLCAVAFATPVDEALMGCRGVTGYHRYMDDGIAFCETRADAEAARGTLVEESERLGLVLNRKKTCITRASQPFVFCKMRYTMLDDGTVRMNVRKQQSRRSVRHARRVIAKSSAEQINLVPVEASLRGYLMRGDADLGWLADKTFGGVL